MTTRLDLRADTLTKPAPAMRRATAEAEVGDDVHSEAPTERRLEERVAALLGKKSALFVLQPEVLQQGKNVSLSTSPSGRAWRRTPRR